MKTKFEEKNIFFGCSIHGNPLHSNRNGIGSGKNKIYHNFYHFLRDQDNILFDMSWYYAFDSTIDAKAVNTK